jgi:hypothetical protein
MMAPVVAFGQQKATAFLNCAAANLQLHISEAVHRSVEHCRSERRYLAPALLDALDVEDCALDQP